MTLYATVDHLQSAALDLGLPVSGDPEAQQRLLDASARAVDGWLGISYDETTAYGELDQRQKDGLRDATCAQSIYVDQSGITDWLGIVDDVSSTGSISFFRPWTWPRLSPAIAEILGGLGLRAAGGSLCAAPSSWRYSPEEEYAAEPEPPAA